MMKKKLYACQRPVSVSLVNTAIMDSIFNELFQGEECFLDRLVALILLRIEV